MSTLRLLGASVAVILGLSLASAAQEPEAAPPKAKAAEGSPKKAPAPKGKKKAAPAKGKKVAAAEDEPAKALEKATFGGGCFWCQEAVFERIKGVKSVVSGYAGGAVPNPDYESVSSGLTGHAEVVQIAFDPEVVPFEKLLDIFWKSHDPTSLNQQGPDFGTQYRSIILYENDDQRQAALAAIKKLNAKLPRNRPAVTEVVELTAFYPAEPYHQDYYRNHKYVPYSQSEIVPKLRKLKLKP